MSTPPWSTSAVLALLLGVTPLGAQGGADLAERLFRSGERAYSAQSYAEALETWNQLIQQAPESPFAAEALLREARYHAQVEHRPELALPLLDSLRKDHLDSPAAPDGLLLRGEILAARSQGPEGLKEAIAEFHRVSDLFPDHPAALAAQLDLGLAYRRQGSPARALSHLRTVLQADPHSPLAARAGLEMAALLDQEGDLQGCLRVFQGVREGAPGTPEAEEAACQILLRVRQRLQRPALRSTGTWPEGRQKWLNTPTLLAFDSTDKLFIYQDDTQLSCLEGGQLKPAGPPVRGVRAVLFPGPWQVSTKSGLVKDAHSALPLPPDISPTGAISDEWGSLWISDGRKGGLLVLPLQGEPRTLPAPPLVGLAPQPLGGAVGASDANRSLIFFDDKGGTRITIPYGQGLPTPFRNVLALATDAAGHVAALVDGDFEGIVLWGPDGTLLRAATYKTLGISGRFRGIALDRKGGILLADRTNDLLLRIE
nr:tetratricopeptide repeat protein [uncultured Holophaga sp.]